MKQVSVVIPAYNAEEFIGLQLEAIRNNTVQPLEVLVVDNGSSDSTVDIVQRYAQEHGFVKIIDGSDVSGANYARNLGIASAAADYILLCDADDIVEPTWVAELAEGLERYDFLGSGYIVYRYNEQTKGYYDFETMVDRPSVFDDRFYSVSCSMALKREVFDATGGFDNSYRGGHEEVDFALRAVDSGFALGWIPKPLIRYRQRIDSAAIARQARNYGRTWVQLALNFSPRYDNHLPSTRLMVRKVVAGVPKYFRHKKHSYEEIRGFWWNVGRLEGGIRYRLLKKLPQRRLYTGLSGH